MSNYQYSLHHGFFVPCSWICNLRCGSKEERRGIKYCSRLHSPFPFHFGLCTSEYFHTNFTLNYLGESMRAANSDVPVECAEKRLQDLLKASIVGSGIFT